MKFFFRLKSISNDKLQEIFARSGSGEVANAFAEKLGKLNFDITKGYMNGAIDLTFKHGGKFYILDWKTTTCGKSLSDYTDAALKESMMDHHYILQYHIYAAALHLYLQARIADYSYDTHFGGAVYAYVRGINSESSNGFFFDRPPEALIKAICNELIGEEN
jgi:exodeoxyribonuclease V beta subunit